ncbi:MAG: hypothetical protein LC115_00805 [Bacteroidia bacterium]|nr:hypothetical protein [Bacteroidia bacterium]
MIHSFHIPVMGLSYTIDTPIKVAHLGISSVISIADDLLLEKARDFYANQFSIPVQSINRRDKDARSSVTTSYLNLVNEIVEKKWLSHINQLVDSAEYRESFLSILPNASYWQREWQAKNNELSKEELTEWAKTQFKAGSIDVNIMTKLDKKNASFGKELPIEYNDAHAALRGFAQSKLSSSVILSAGINIPLFSYMQKFDDFFPDVNGNMTKKIIIKVSDYRSALIQGKMLAKKGLWVSEFRIESGLNCGGHAFATQGYLMGPILEEFKQKRSELYNELLTMWRIALKSENRYNTEIQDPKMKVSAQGGVGTHQEHEFLLKYYEINSVGWGSPFLLVPEAVSVDDDTMKRLANATEEDLYLSNASPLGVPFNNLRNSTRQQYQQKRVDAGRLGSPCPKKFLQLNTEYGEKPICTASTQYIDKSIEKLHNSNLTEQQLEAAKEKLYEKECLCCGLAFSFLEKYNIDRKVEKGGVSVCPGPNIAYFDRISSLSDMIMHIYGMKNLITRTDRPNMFIKEIQLYMDFLAEKIHSSYSEPNEKAKNYINQFIENMKSGVDYYKTLFQTELPTLNLKQNIQNALNDFLDILEEKKESTKVALL